MSDSLHSRDRTAFLRILLSALTLLMAAPGSSPIAIAGIGDARISGQVLDEQGKPVEGVLVQIVAAVSGEQSFEGATNKKGRFIFPAVPPAAYRPMIDAEGYLLQSVRATVRNPDGSATQFEEPQVRANGSPTMSVGLASRITLELRVAPRAKADAGSASLHGLESASGELEVLNALFELEDWEELLKRSESFLADNPGDGGATYLRAVALWRSGRLSDARDHFLQALESIPEQPGLHGTFGAMLLEYGSQLAEQGDAGNADSVHAEAREQLEAQLEATPGMLTHLVNHVIACERVGDLARAVPSLRKLIELEPERLEFQTRLAELLIELERPDEAVAVLEHLPGEPADRARLIYNASIIHWNESRWEQTLATVEIAIGLQPTEGLYHRLKGRVLLQLNRNDEAIAALKRAVELNPDDAEAATDRALIQALEK